MSNDPLRDALNRLAQQKALEDWAAARGKAIIGRFLTLARQQGLKPDDDRGWILSSHLYWQRSPDVTEPELDHTNPRRLELVLTPDGRLIEYCRTNDGHRSKWDASRRAGSDEFVEELAAVVQRIRMQWTDQGIARTPPKPV